MMDRNRIIAEWRRGMLSLQAAAVLIQAGLYADAISRMYYAILHTATAALLTKGIAPATHQAAAALLNQHLIHAGDLERALLDIYRDAMKTRHTADYDAAHIFSPGDAADSYQDAEQFIARIRRYLLAQGFTDDALAVVQPV